MTGPDDPRDQLNAHGLRLIAWVAGLPAYLHPAVLDLLDLLNAALDNGEIIDPDDHAANFPLVAPRLRRLGAAIALRGGYGAGHFETAWHLDEIALDKAAQGKTFFE